MTNYQKNDNIDQLLVLMEDLMKVVNQLPKNIKRGQYDIFINTIYNVYDITNSLYKFLLNLDKTYNRENIKLELALQNFYVSLTRIEKLFNSRSNKINDKIEFELIPILEDLYLQLYYWYKVYPDEEKIEYYEKYDLVRLSCNKYIDFYEAKGDYKYDLSVIITGYNKLEYTKLCIENLLKYIPKNINYELILYNHGSSDETKQYFENICPTKQLDIFNNSASPTAIHRIIEGKYTLNISNDVIVTQNAIENMIKCMDSDESIAWIVPSTSNMCNNQSLEVNYTTIDEMHEFANKNNKVDPYRWEQRQRLCNPIDLQRSKIWYSSDGIGWGGHFHTTNQNIAPDEKVSLILRRRGYKMILAKDAYCHHFGGVTRKDEIVNYIDKNGNEGSEYFYKEARLEFYKKYKIDPLGIGVEYDPVLFENINFEKNNELDILGINCGIGATPLKIKEIIKEKAHNLNSTIFNITDDENYIEDLRAISNYIGYFDDINNVEEMIKFNNFDYIIFESKLEKYNDILNIVNLLKSKLKEGGLLILYIIDLNLINTITNYFIDTLVINNNWVILK